MNSQPADKIRSALTQGLSEEALKGFEHLDPDLAASLLLSLPFEQQKSLFCSLPTEFASKLIAAIPYYHAYVLLHCSSIDRMRTIIDQMNPGERLGFFDELPEEAWQRLMDELSIEAPLADGTRAEPEIRSDQIVASAPPIIEARAIEKKFELPGGGYSQVIAPLDLRIEPDKIIALLGPSGCGKSTLLRILTGLASATGGEVLWHGKPLRESLPNVAIVFQSFALFPWLTVMENVEVPLLARGVEKQERERRASTCIRSVGLHGFENAYPKELSGGMKQRVGFARALAVEPEILFMDEPFSALDVLTADNLRGELLELWAGKKIPTRSIFLVTHNIEEAVLLADRIIVLGRNPAKIRADFAIQLRQPRERNAADFLVYVDYIYKLITQPEVAPSPPVIAGSGAKARYPMLPHARPGGIAGLLELLQDRGGQEDLYRIADELRMEIDDLLPIVDAASLLGFAKAQKGDVEATTKGVALAEADIPTRRTLFREAVLANVPLLQQMKNTLEGKSDHAMPVEFFRDILDQHFAKQEVDRQIETALDWGRYGEIFTYDSQQDRVHLYTPVESVKAEPNPTDVF